MCAVDQRDAVPSVCPTGPARRVVPHAQAIGKLKQTSWGQNTCHWPLMCNIMSFLNKSQLYLT
jgi:hypothetical protein